MIAIENVTTAKELADAMCKVAKEQKWHTFVGPINGKQVRVKVFGSWPQIFDVDGVRYGASSELGSLKNLNAFVLNTLA